MAFVADLPGLHELHRSLGRKSVRVRQSRVAFTCQDCVELLQNIPGAQRHQR
jgi:hypothetical protein